jgi:ArsR family transcriptional regulator
MESNDAIERLSALAHVGRLAVFRLLVQTGPDGLPAGEIARTLGAPANTMSTQLAILARAGLIQSRRESRSIIYSASYPEISGLLAFLIQDCCQGRPEVCGPVLEAACCAPINLTSKELAS